MTNHTLHTPQPTGINLLNNGGFTSYGRRWAAVPNTGAFRTPWAVDNLDTGLYARLGGAFGADDDQLSGWDVSGASASMVISPRNSEGFEITTPDPGNVLQISFLADGDLLLSQDVADVKRLYDADISISLGGVFIKGKPEVAIELVVDEEITSLVEVSAAAFGSYRRVGAYASLPAKMSQVQVRIRLTGCAGESVGLSGVMAALGTRTANTQFSSSLVDRVVPAGTVFMVIGEACPSGYVEMGKEGSLVITSGTKAFQYVGDEAVRELGQREHSHHPDDSDPMSEPIRDTFTTETPLTSGVAPVNAVQFGDYLPYNPYPGEIPDQTLSRSHSHTIQTRMQSAPPTFPVRYCGKL